MTTRAPAVLKSEGSVESVRELPRIESGSLGRQEVSFPRSASVSNFEVKILSPEILNCIDQVVALTTFGTSTFKVSYITKTLEMRLPKHKGQCISSGWPCI